MTTTSTFQGIDPNDPKTTSKVLAPPGGKTSVNLFGGDSSTTDTRVQRGSKHADRNASSVCFQAGEGEKAKAAKPADTSSSNLFGPPPVRESPRQKPGQTHSALFGAPDPQQAKSVQKSNPVTGEGVTSFMVGTEFREERRNSTGSPSPQKSAKVVTDFNIISGEGVEGKDDTGLGGIPSLTPRKELPEYNIVSGEGVEPQDDSGLGTVFSSPEKKVVGDYNIVSGTGVPCRDDTGFGRQSISPAPRSRDVIRIQGVEEDECADTLRFYRVRSPSPAYRDPVRLIGLNTTEKLFPERGRTPLSLRKAASERNVVSGEGVPCLDDVGFARKKSPLKVPDPLQRYHPSMPPRRKRFNQSPDKLVVGDYNIVSGTGVPCRDDTGFGRHSISPGKENPIVGTERSRVYEFPRRPPTPEFARKVRNPITGEGMPDFAGLLVDQCTISPRVPTVEEKRGNSSAGIFGNEAGGGRSSTKVMAPPGGKSQISFG